MLKMTSLACASFLALSGIAQASISLKSVNCVGNKVNVNVRQTGFESHRVYVIITSSSAPQESQSKLTLFAPGDLNLSYTFSSSLLPFGTISVYTTDLSINKIYHGCP